jgi:titin
MPNRVKVKRTYTAGVTPTTAELGPHEFAVNWADGIVFVKAADGSIQSVTLGGAGSGSGSGSGGGSANIAIFEATTAAGFPATGASSTLYIATDANRVFRFDASGVYVEIGTSGGGGSGGDGTDAVLRALFAPGAPTSVTATAGNTQVSLSWTAPTGVISQSPVNDYVVQFSSNSGSTWTMFGDGTSAATSTTVTGLTNGTAYVFRVAAVNGVGTGSYSSASSSVTPAAPPVITIGTQPSNQTASSGAATFSVSASVTQSATLSYQWQRSTDSGSTFTAISGATSSSLALTGLVSGDNGNQYRVVVSATGGATSVTSSAATLTVSSSFTPMAALLTSGTSYTVPSGATSMKAWAVGGGGNAYASPNPGAAGAGGTAFKTWSVSGGSAVTYSAGAGAASYTGSLTNGGNTTVTYAGTTITGNGGIAGNGSTSNPSERVGAGGSFSGGDGGANGGAGTLPDGYTSAGGAVGGNSQPILMCAGYTEHGRRPATNVSGLLEAVALAGGVATQVCGATSAFGSGGHEAQKNEDGDDVQPKRNAGLGGGGTGSTNGGGGAVVLYFT